MDWQSIFAVSAAGMRVEQTRFNVAAVNLANANAVMARDGSGFRPLSAITALTSQAAPFGSHLRREEALALHTPQIQSIIEQNVSPRRVYDPGHPEADDKGFVQMPGVNPTLEMLNIITALRSYESNVVAMNAAKSMAQKALEIGSGS
jgi:flagellar basal-body rod protein FlgC